MPIVLHGCGYWSAAIAMHYGTSQQVFDDWASNIALISWF
jgi:hypothetical protein